MMVWFPNSSTWEPAQEELMAINKLNPYIMFNGTADKALKFYEKALGAKIEGLMRFGDVKEVPSKPEDKTRVMHALVRLDAGEFMVSDAMPGKNEPTESNMHVCLNFDNVDDMTRKFDALSAGGKITGPLQDTFWGAKFGTLTDQFSVNWMFNCELKKG